MSQAIGDNETRVEIQSTILTLFDALYNDLILRNTVPYLPLSSLLNLAATNKSFRHLLYQTPGVFRHLDLTQVKTAQFNGHELERPEDIWHNVHLNAYLTEDDFYSGPLRGVFTTLRHRNILENVQSLILDGLSVTAEMCHEIINDSNYSVRLLSIRDVKNMNHNKLRAALRYACRGSRPEGAPRLKALYVFGSKDNAIVALSDASGTHESNGTDQALTTSLAREPEAWWSKRGKIFNGSINEDWANTMLDCQGLIAFDAVLCQGPRHRNSPALGPASQGRGSNPAVATFAIDGCASCGKAPEGMLHADKTSPSCLPLLSPPPLLSSSVRSATRPECASGSFVPRCFDCVRERYCVCCKKWWCEACYRAPGQNILDLRPVNVDMNGNWNSTDNMEPQPMEATGKVRNGLCPPCLEDMNANQGPDEQRRADDVGPD